MKSGDDLPERLAQALERVEALTRTREQSAAQDLGLSVLQVRVLRTLRRHGAVRVGALARELLLTHGTVSEAVRVLVDKGLARKEPDPEEHRAVLVSSTRAGKAALRKAGRWPQETLGPVVAGLGPEAAGDVLTHLLALLLSLERAGLIETTHMCGNCQHFRPGRGKGKRPHYCSLLETSIGRSELQVDCPDFAPGTEGLAPSDLLS